MDSLEAQELVDNFLEDFLAGAFDDPEEEFMSQFGLEPDYLFDLLV